MTTQTGSTYAALLQESFDRLLALYTELSPQEVERAELGDGWTPKTLLAHVGFWDDFQTQRMEEAMKGASAMRGVMWPEEDNDVRMAADSVRSWPEVAAQATAARRRMIAFAAALDDDALTRAYPEGKRMLSLSTLLTHMVRHTEEHAALLRAYGADRAE